MILNPHQTYSLKSERNLKMVMITPLTHVFVTKNHHSYVSFFFVTVNFMWSQHPSINDDIEVCCYILVII